MINHQQYHLLFCCSRTSLKLMRFSLPFRYLFILTILLLGYYMRAIIKHYSYNNYCFKTIISQKKLYWRIKKYRCRNVVIYFAASRYYIRSRFLNWDTGGGWNCKRRGNYLFFFFFFTNLTFGPEKKRNVGEYYQMSMSAKKSRRPIIKLVMWRELATVVHILLKLACDELIMFQVRAFFFFFLRVRELLLVFSFYWAWFAYRFDGIDASLV